MSVRVRPPSSVNVHSRRSPAVNHQDSAATHLGVKVIRRNVMAANRTAGKAHAKTSSAKAHAVVRQLIVIAGRIAMIRVVAIQTIAPAAAIQAITIRAVASRGVASRVAMSLAVATAVTSLETTAAAIVKMAPAKTERVPALASAAIPQVATEKGSKQEPAAQVDAADPYRP